MQIRKCGLIALLAVSGIVASGSAHAAPISWKIVSSASSISLAIPNQTLTITSTASISPPLVGTSISVSMRALNPGTGTASTPTGWTIGNVENIFGTLQTDTDFQSFIKFLDVQDPPNSDPTTIDGIDSGSYAPLADGSPGTALGDFGTRIFAGNPVGVLNLDFAFRNMLYDLTSGVIGTSGSLNNHTFPASSTFFGVENADLAFRARNGGGLAGSAFVGLIGSGSANIGGFGTDNTAGNGSIVVTPQVGGDLAVLTIPITQTLLIPLDSDGLLVFKLNVSGTIVATAIVPEPATVGMLALGLAMLAPVAIRRRRRA
jgi:hypothetical protein